jgi:hypothetical protein
LGVGLMLVLGGLSAGFVACPPPAQRLGAGHGDGATVPARPAAGAGFMRDGPAPARPGTVGAPGPPAGVR